MLKEIKVTYIRTTSNKISMLMDRRLKNVEPIILPKLIYRYTTIPSKIPAGYSLPLGLSSLYKPFFINFSK